MTTIRQRRRRARNIRCAAIDKRYLAPILVTAVLIAGQVTFGFLESWSRTALAIATAIAVGRCCSAGVMVGKVAAPRERLHHGDQRRHAGAVARVLAVRALFGRSRSRRST